MKTEYAQFPQAPRGDDRLVIARDAVAVLDGASAFRTTEVSAAAYADALSQSLGKAMDRNRDDDLSELLANSISEVVKQFNLKPGSSPSSTVAILRKRSEAVDILVLGDCLVATPFGIITDERLSGVAQQERTEYQERLRRGGGYDDHHKQLLTKLQEQQARFRNQTGGYWIAEAEPEAALHAATAQLPLSYSFWAVLATDGAYKPLGRLGLDAWQELSTCSANELHRLLRQCEEHEDSDPHGMASPRAKVHDDKTLVIART